MIDVSSFSDLPFVLQVNFVYLNCLCEFDLSRDECCGAGVNEGGISTAGTGPPGGGPTPPTESEAAYLTVVCGDTQASIDYAIEDGVPTRVPTTLAPTVVVATELPTTMSPMTLAPVVTLQPSSSPTRKPSMEPTVSPSTKEPTVPPSLSPVTDSPVTTAPATTAPVISPTSAPVVAPVTKAPSTTTESPSTKLPTETGRPTTLAPSKKPTSMKPTFDQLPTVPTTLGPTSVDVPTTIKPTVPTTPETPSPTFQFQPSMQPSIAATSPSNPGKKPDNGGTTFEPIAPGAVAGIVLACVGVALVGVLVTSRKRKRGNEEDPSFGDLSDKADRDLEAGEGGKGLDDDDDGPPGGELIGSDSSHLSSLGSPDEDGDMEVGNYDIPQTRAPSPPRDPALIPIVAGIPSSPRNRRHVDSNDDSSSAGASGWSSSAGMSSLNTASLADASLASTSFDTGMDDALSTGSPSKALATIAAAIAVVQTTRVTQNDSEPVFIPLDGSQSTEDDISSPNSPVGLHSTPQGEVSRADLDKAIEAGDWAAVGATAALLAVTSKHPPNSEKGSQQESSSKLSSSMSRDSSSMADDDASSSKELDELVATGDWEGVVLAAAKIEEGRSETNRSLDEDTVSSGYTGGSKVDRDLSEIRSEVELLVRRVVPDEVENIDEMMLQFKGREGELVETLRTMQERTVAQRARQAIRKSAKMEAKARALENRDRSNSLSSEDPSFYDDSGDDDSSVSDLGSQDMSISEGPPSSKQATITSLELAVQQGDWRAVGEAGAMMGGAGIAPGGDSETSSYVESDLQGSGSLEGSSSLQDSSLATSTASTDENKETRITHLDDLIAKGDWSGIVAAAGKYQATDEQGQGQASEEEREALAGAKMWQKIASHSKSESVTENDESAAAATDWAISRRLEQIQNVTGPTTGDDESV